jgi:hypothetical protein
MTGRIIFFSLLGVIVFLFILSLITGPPRISWRESFSHKSNQPYGSRVLYDLLPSVFPQAEIELSSEDLYYLLEDDWFENSCLFVQTHSFLPDEYDVSELLFYLKQGNHAVISAREFSYEFMDSLGIRIVDARGKELGLNLTETGDSSLVEFVNPALAEYRGYDMVRSQEPWSFRIADTTDISVLANNQFGRPCLIKFPIGSGWALVCSAPRMFTNYHLLNQDDQEFASLALSHVPVEVDRFIWDQHYKPAGILGGSSGPDGEANRPGSLSYINQEPALRWAFWLVVGTLLLYALFESKRKQRVIPDRPPLPNATLEFTETVGRLYYQSHDHKNVAEKKIKILLAFIRSHYFMQAQPGPQSGFSPEFIQTLSGKTGMALGDVRALFRLVSRVRKQSHITESELMELNMLVETFYQIAIHGRKPSSYS